MIWCLLQGGLGNQLFQIYAGLAYVIEHKDKLKFPATKLDVEQRPMYWDTMLKRLKDGVDTTCNIRTMPKLCEKSFQYEKLPKQTNVMLCGYFQSYKYFDKYSDIIFKNLNFKMEQELIRTKYLTLQNTISLHFRIGDYIHLQLHHYLLMDDYYIKAIRKIIQVTEKEDWNLIYFCEEKDNVPVEQRIRKIKKQFPALTLYKADDSMLDWEQLLLMSCSDHHIIANSAFSWWAAYLNQSKSKVVCYPTKWFGLANSHNTLTDLCPPSWIPIT
jgi:hypothetical protein